MRRALYGSETKRLQRRLSKANQGTLFLDEIGEISHPMQVALYGCFRNARLRRSAERKKFRLISESLPPHIVICASLPKEGKSGRTCFTVFMSIRLSRLLYANAPKIFRIFSSTTNRRIIGLANFPCFLDMLKQWRWPGNIRELFNVFERLSIRFPDGRLKDEPLTALLEVAGLPIIPAEKAGRRRRADPS